MKKLPKEVGELIRIFDSSACDQHLARFFFLRCDCPTHNFHGIETWLKRKVPASSDLDFSPFPPKSKVTEQKINAAT